MSSGIVRLKATGLVLNAVVVTILTIACAGQAPNERSISKATFAGTWPFTVLAGRLACQRPGKNVTFTVEGRSDAANGAHEDRTYAVNRTARGAAEKRGWLSAEHITKEKTLAAATPYAKRVSEDDRRFIFARWIDCDDRFKEGTTARELCESDLVATMRVTPEELSLIRSEGLIVGWPPLKRIRESVADIITEGLKLCK